MFERVDVYHRVRFSLNLTGDKWYHATTCTDVELCRFRAKGIFVDARLIRDTCFELSLRVGCIDAVVLATKRTTACAHWDVATRLWPQKLILDVSAVTFPKNVSHDGSYIRNNRVR